MKITDRPSPNFDGRENRAVEMLVLHYTGMRSAAEALDRLCTKGTKVSAHYVIDEDGTAYRLVDESNRAWHAGVARWRGHSDINHRSIGIELVNPGHEFGYRDFPPRQIESLIPLCKEILKRHSIPPRNVVGHSDIAPSRKEDPGEKFPWEHLAKNGIGLWPSNPGERQASAQDLMRYGYDLTDSPAEKTILAFQRHFRPRLLNGQWDAECAALLESLLKMV